jgi:hypothetical protein
MTKPSLSAVQRNDLDPSEASSCTWCQHAESIHAYAGRCLFSECECPFFTPPAEPDCRSPLVTPMTPNVDDGLALAPDFGRAERIGEFWSYRRAGPSPNC